MPRAFLPYHDLTSTAGTALGVNEARHIVGTYDPAPDFDRRRARAFLYNGGILNDLNTLDDAVRRGWWFAAATAVGENGSILGWGPHPETVDCSSRTCLAPVHGYVIKPVQNWCSYQLLTAASSPSRPDYIYVPPTAGSAALDVLPDRASCAWSVRKILRSAGDGSDWLTVPELTAATGARTVQPTFAANTTGAWRFGQMEVAGRHVWIAQAAAIVSASDAQPADEGTTATFTVTLSTPLPTATSVSWSVEAMTAGGPDVVDTAGLLQFAPGKTTAQVDVRTVDDDLLEGEEVFRLRLVVTDGAAIVAPGVARGRIRASDPRVGSRGGIVAHPRLGERAQVVVPAGALTERTEVTLAIDEDAGASLPTDISAATPTLAVRFSPSTSASLPAPGLTVTLPLLQPLAPGTALVLQEYDDQAGTWRPLVDVAGVPVRGTVESTGTTAVFAGIPRATTLIGAQRATAPMSTRYLAEGASTSFFTTRLALLNPAASPSRALLSFLRQDGTTRERELVVPARTRATLDPADTLGSGRAEFATMLVSDVPLVLERTMTWDESGYGSHAEAAAPSPSLAWYLAEGATHSAFDLFYLLQNPGAFDVQVDVEYLLSPPALPLRKQYRVPARSRVTIWVDQEDSQLASTAVSARITATAPIVVERAMYLSSADSFAAGHGSMGTTRQSERWVFAEGATGRFFDTFLLLANTHDVEAEVRARYLLPSGDTVTRTYRVAPRSRFTIWVDLEDPRLADTAVSTVIESTNAVPLVAERAMWWAGSDPSQWREAHNSAGAVDTGTRWALAEGEVGGAAGHETYILVANTSSYTAQVRATLLLEDGSSVSRTFMVAANSRFNISVGDEFPELGARRFGALVESLGDVPAQLVVERAMYSSARGVTWAAGTSLVATRLQ